MTAKKRNLKCNKERYNNQPSFIIYIYFINDVKFLILFIIFLYYIPLKIYLLVKYKIKYEKKEKKTSCQSAI